MDSIIKIGSQVALKAGGGPWMTVTKIEGENCTCSWHDKNHVPQEQEYPKASVRIRFAVSDEPIGGVNL